VSVHFIDPPGPLAGTNEVLDFTTDRLVTSISIEFSPHRGNGARETVWDGPEGDGLGDFSYLYRGSSRTGTGPYTWHVKRTGGWPAELRIRVQEYPSAISVPALQAVDATAVAQWELGSDLLDRSGSGNHLGGSLGAASGKTGDLIPGTVCRRYDIFVAAGADTPFQITGDLTVVFRTAWSGGGMGSQASGLFIAGAIQGTNTPGPWGVENGLASGNKIRFRSSGGVDFTSVASLTSAWDFVAVRRLSGVWVRIQINGTSQQFSSAVVPAASGATLRVLGEVTEPFNASLLKDLSIWNRCLSDSEIAACRATMMGL
jgi:hypothetical protein